MAASAAAVARVLHEAGYEMEERVTRPHPDKERRFERARPNQLWQTDLFTFVLKRQNRRQAAAILEVLAGVLRPAEAAQALETSLARYYVLERRALAGLLAACEPCLRGPRISNNSASRSRGVMISCSSRPSAVPNTTAAWSGPTAR